MEIFNNINVTGKQSVFFWCYEAYFLGVFYGIIHYYFLQNLLKGEMAFIFVTVYTQVFHYRLYSGIS